MDVLSLLGIEIWTAVLGLALLVVGLLVPKTQRNGIGFLTTVGLTGLLLATFAYSNTDQSILAGTYVIDPFGRFFKQLFLAAAILVSIASQDYVRRLGYNQGEFFSLVVFATLGMMVLASAGDLITLYIGLELMTISFIILTSFKKQDAKSSEAGIKYVILGAMSSAILLYGLSLVYGVTGTTVIAEISRGAGTGGDVPPLMVLGIVFVLAGFAFKISAVPFHMWAPDIYEGAPTPVTAFLAVASKAASFAILLRMFLIAFPEQQTFWGTLIVLLAVLTMVLGNLVAIPQTNIKRLLAYSSISQAGYLLLGLIAFSSLGVGAILFHSLFYVFANMGAFMVAIAFSNHTGSDEIKDYSGLARRSPLLAGIMLFSLLSLAGIPPLAGFVSKFYLFTAVIGKGYVWLAIIAVVMSMVSVYYYLLVVKAMYLGEPPAGSEPITITPGLQLALLLAVAVIFIFGVYPAPLTEVAMNVANAFFPTP